MMTLRQFFKLLACPLIAGIFIGAGQLPSWRADPHDAFLNWHPDVSRESFADKAEPDPRSSSDRLWEILSTFPPD
jgi:hypothetical protein